MTTETFGLVRRGAGVLACVVLVVACAAASVGQPSSNAAIVIANVNVLAMDREAVLEGQTVVVERDIITRVGPTASIKAPAGARVIDGGGKYLMPGLADVHVHLASNPESEQHALLKLFVANGVTTVLNMRGIPQILQLKSGVAAGRVLGPVIYSVGPYLNEPFVTTPDEVERAVVEQKRAGYDFIKMHGDLRREAYARLNAVARREGIRVIGHAPRNLGIEAMFEERQYGVAHAEEFIYDRTHRSRHYLQVEPQIPSLARSMKETGTWLMPNLTAFHIIGLMAQNLDAILARPEMRYLPVSVQRGWGPATNPYTARFGKDAGAGILARHGFLQKLTRGFHQGGVRLLIGTDAMNTGVVPGFSVHDEMAEFVTAGLTPFDALRAATANAAEFLSAGGQRGVLAVGQRADLLLLDANPLENIANTRRLSGVMLRGRWLARADVDAMLSELAARPQYGRVAAKN